MKTANGLEKINALDEKKVKHCTNKVTTKK